jgi:1,4-dihydroxy-2-naphthoate octaprenyltransferase
LKQFFHTIRAPFFTATATSTILGTAIAWHDGYLNLWYFLLAFLGVICANAGINTANDYYDHLSTDDEVNQELTPFSGGSRVIQEGVVPPRRMLVLSLISFALTVIIGLYLTWACGWPVLAIGLVAMFISFFYDAPPVKLAYRGHGLGELTTGLAAGPLAVCGAYYVQAQTITWPVVWASLPIGILTALILYINEFPDYVADKTAGKHTLVVVLGKRRAVPGYIILLVIVYATVVIGAVAEALPYAALLALLPLPLAYQAVQGLRRHYDQTPLLIPAQAATIKLHLITAVLLSASYLIDMTVGRLVG